MFVALSQMFFHIWQIAQCKDTGEPFNRRYNGRGPYGLLKEKKLARIQTNLTDPSFTFTENCHQKVKKGINIGAGRLFIFKKTRSRK